MPAVFIYALCEPDLWQDVRYIGATRQRIKQRLCHHIDNSRKSNSAKSQWIQSLLSKKLKPSIKLLETADMDTWEEAERKWIAYYRQQGASLFNLLPGGIPLDTEYKSLRTIRADSGKRYFATKEHRTKRGEAMKRYYAAHPETREKISLSMKELRQKQRESKQ